MAINFTSAPNKKKWHTPIIYIIDTNNVQGGANHFYHEKSFFQTTTSVGVKFGSFTKHPGLGGGFRYSHYIS